jgi:hypothetical protein
MLADSGPTAVGAGGRCMRAQPVLNRGGWVADKWAQGHSNGRRGVKRFKLFPNLYGSKTFKIFQILTDPKGTFPSSKNLE